MQAFRKRQLAQYTQTAIIVNAIQYGAGVVASALSDGESPSPDKVNDLLNHLKSLLLPDLAEEKDEQAKKAMKAMEEEIKKGPFQVEGMQYNGGKRKR